jgi:hypothetical protein
MFTRHASGEHFAAYPICRTFSLGELIMQILSDQSTCFVSGSQSLWELEYDTGGRPGDVSGSPFDGASWGVNFGIGPFSIGFEVKSCPAPNESGGGSGESGFQMIRGPYERDPSDPFGESAAPRWPLPMFLGW